ncbi:beta-propeller fold lactonase family protein [Streptosporangium vulgare]|uniref:beta-propeller fold lactonase family protein n=1 Tax=Streptosporangium vulgare TaxID=46190 RepID=UPI003370C7D7
MGGESERGTVGVFARAGDGTLSPLAQRPSEGSAPCHLAVDPTGTRLAVANYGDERHGQRARHRRVRPPDRRVDLPLP